MMRTKIAALAGGMLLAGLATPATAETKLLFNQWVPFTHHFHARILKPWADRVGEATKVRVVIEFTPTSLGAPPRQYELALNGIAAITSANQSYTPDRFKLAVFAEMPFMSQSAEALSVANWQVTNRYPEIMKEYAGTKLLAVNSNGGATTFTRSTQINTIEDFKGLKLRTQGGPPTEIAKILGATPVGAPITEAYQMLSRGVVDGLFLPPDSVMSFKMQEHLKEMSAIEKGLYNSTFFLVMNEAKWDALPAEDKAAIEAVSGEAFAREAGKIWDDQDRMALKAFEGAKMRITKASPALEAKLREALKPIEAAWLKTALEAGLHGEKVLAETRALVAGYEPGK